MDDAMTPTILFTHTRFEETGVESVSGLFLFPFLICLGGDIHTFYQSHF